MYVFTYECVQKRVYVHIYRYAYMYYVYLCFACLFVCVYNKWLHVYIYIYVCTYLCIHIHLYLHAYVKHLCAFVCLFMRCSVQKREGTLLSSQRDCSEYTVLRTWLHFARALRALSSRQFACLPMATHRVGECVNIYITLMFKKKKKMT